MAMTAADARDLLHTILSRVAPDVDLDTIDPDAQILEAGGLDSLDFLRLVAMVGEETGIAVPERDYPALSTAAGFVDYLVASAGITPARRPPSP